MKQRDGYVYILSNESMPGLLKIGRSIHGGKSRAKDIYQTGVPTPFNLEFEAYSKDCIEDEILVHEELAESRVSDAREFFRVELDEAMQSVVNVVCASKSDRLMVDQIALEAIASVEVMADKMIKLDDYESMYGNNFLGIVSVISNITAEEFKPLVHKARARVTKKRLERKQGLKLVGGDQ